MTEQSCYNLLNSSYSVQSCGGQKLFSTNMVGDPTNGGGGDQ